ncbi:Alpha/Beta hydrolase protein [Pseudoneurospora amorphoporcata]|uniref:Alpha/Beta hydrolase protein n=1 Tax=Pseudoneurospora amorphoporcata TaxID=241081 RepID=A0AAN6NT72_9PEZI|nr:Alpha/Beta hydrolase protein [Pseudoneurospora amorphoporcata]
MAQPHHEAPPTAATCERLAFSIGQMRVEKLVPTVNHKGLMPIILLHGDYHTGSMWLTKPDSQPGWAVFFAERGHRVYAPQLPFQGRSGASDYYERVKVITPQTIENLYTAISKANDPEWLAAKKHTQWPGSGIRGDPIFDQYSNQLVPMYMDAHERQTAAQEAVESLLRFLKRPAILIGHGSGANVAWLAADVAPDLVHAIVAVEPLGPPFGSALQNKNGELRPTSKFTRAAGVRPYGLADIPMQFDPPVAAPESFEELFGGTYPAFEPIPVTKFFERGRQGKFCFEQDLAGVPVGNHTESRAEPRKLTNLVGIPQLVVTTEASFHRLSDWATVHFLRQAGTTVKHHRLEEHGIRGNGHICFLEKNSNDVANHVLKWLHNEAAVPKVQPLQSPPSPFQATSASGEHGQSAIPPSGKACPIRKRPAEAELKPVGTIANSSQRPSKKVQTNTSQPSTIDRHTSINVDVRATNSYITPSVSTPHSSVVRNIQVARGVAAVPSTPHNKPIQRTGQTTLSERRIVEITCSPDSPTPRPIQDLVRQGTPHLNKLPTVPEAN